MDLPDGQPINEKEGSIHFPVLEVKKSLDETDWLRVTPDKELPDWITWLFAAPSTP